MRRLIRPAGETFDDIAHAFHATRSSPWPFVQGWLEEQSARLGHGPVVLDVGCGNGRHLRTASDLGLTCLGVDASSALLTIARSVLPGEVGLIAGDARSLPIGGGVVGAVLAVALLHHVPEEDGRRMVAEELHRVAAPGAHGLVSVWALDDPEVADRARARPVPGCPDGDLFVPWRLPGGLLAVDRYYRRIGLEELADLMEKAGFAVERRLHEGTNHVVHVVHQG